MSGFEIAHQWEKSLELCDGKRSVPYLAIPSQIYEEFFRLRFIEEGVREYQIYLVI